MAWRRLSGLRDARRLTPPAWPSRADRERSRRGQQEDGMFKTWLVRAFAAALCALAVTEAAAQVSTGTVFGTVKDAQGGVIPGATVTLISETRGTKSTPVTTNTVG